MKRLILLLMMLSLLGGCAHAASTDYDLEFTKRELSGEWDEKDAVTITGQGKSCRINGSGAVLDGNFLTVTEEGTYILTGEFRDILLVISASDKDKVQIVLSDAQFVSAICPVIYAQEADKVFITLAEGTENLLHAGSDKTVSDGTTELDAAVFSRVDLCINGKASLTIRSDYKHGVVSKDDLVIANATLTVEAASTALDGKDCVMMQGVTAALTAGSNGVRSDNAEDAGRGYVYIADSTLVITAGTDGIEAENYLRADNARLTITTGEGSAAASPATQMNWGKWDSWGKTSSDTSGSWKALKSGGDLEINGGTYTIDSQDDSIHTNGNLLITDGTFTLLSGDDGIHADNELLISGGEFLIGKAYEGIEASKLTISGGRFDITSTDDGLNAAGGADGSASADRWGRAMFSNGVGEINISGGYIHINAEGDGIDSNSNIHISGGVTLVSGSASNMNAAFDYDGEATVTGGIMIAVGGSGMAQSFTKAENQGCMLFGLSGGIGGVNLAIVDENDRVVAAYTPKNNYSAVVFTAPALQLGNTYTVVTEAVIDGADANGFAADAAYSSGTSVGTVEMTELIQGGSGHSMGGPGGPGGHRPRH